MLPIKLLPLPSDQISALRAGGPDAYGNPPERAISDGEGAPCRHCLGQIPKGAGMLILAHRPFGALQPYAETGPIFLCAAPCAPWSGEGLPEMFASPEYLIKGYTADERIRYGTGKVVVREEILSSAAELLELAEIAFVDIRSARNNCYHARVVRAA